MIASLFLALAAAILPFPQQGEEYLPWLLERLESADPDVRSSSYHALLAENDAASAALVRFASASAIARELRAKVLAERGGAAQVEATLKLAREDPDREVQEQLLRFFGRSDLDAASAEKRCAVAGELGLRDGAISETAVEVLQRLEYPCAGENLLRIVRLHPVRERREGALKALLRRWTGGRELLDFAENPGSDRSMLGPVLLALGDRVEPRASAVFRRYWDDPDPRLRAGAQQGFAALQVRRAQRDEAQEAFADFRKLRASCGDRPEILLEEGEFLLLHAEDAREAAGAGEEVLRRLREKPGRAEAVQQVRARTIIGASRLLGGASSEADRILAAAGEECLEVLRSVDDFEEPEQGYAVSILLGKIWSLRALNAAASSAEGLPSVTECWNTAYEVSRKVQRYRDDWIAQTRKKAGSWPYNMDEILGGEIGFFSLMDGPIVRRWGKERAEILWRETAVNLSKLNAGEFPPVLQEQPAPERPPERSMGESERRLPSDFPVRLADFFESGLGKSEDALAVYRKLAQAWRLRLNDFPGFAQDVARVESRIASLLMDQRDGAGAEAALRRALGLLEDLQALLQARSGDGADAQVQAQMSTVYVSFAVNENVVKAKPEEARTYLEKAFALDPSPFNRVLLACYEARAGRVEAARRTLEQVDPEPGLFYNLACTSALLEEKAKALAFLEKHFRIALRGAGERKRGAEWARKDPDLESLRGNETFEQLLRKAQEGMATK